MVRLDKAEVFLTPEDGGERRKMIDAAPHAELAPGATWSEKFQVASKTPPKCTHEVVYTPMRTVTKRVLGVVKKTAQTIPVACIEYVKAFDPPEVNSFDKTPVEVTIEVKNTGSARLNEVVIEDHLPDDVMPPKREHIRFWVAGTEYKSPVGITIEPEDQDPTKPHKLTFRLTDLKDSVGELRPGQSVKVNYAIMAWRNRPEKEYPSPIHCKANTFPAGLYAEAASAQDGHKLGIVYKKRAISVKKGINKGANAGEYNVVLAVENKGQVTVENVRVTDWVPAAFSYVSTEPVGEEPVSKPATDGTIMEWTWARMNPGEAKRLTVTVRGSGEYERREPEVVSD
ncbi:MAG: DUF11 domain-containing protein [Candidatus Thorarchaeota archaeon]|nr:DUF11 domain-containing protein [Candidatus Thorarchaeota archaeon]